MNKLILACMIVVLSSTGAWAQNTGNNLTQEEERILTNFVQEFPGAAKKYDRAQLIRFVKNDQTKQRMINALQNQQNGQSDGLTRRERNKRMENYLKEQKTQDRKELKRIKEARQKEERIKNARENNASERSLEVRTNYNKQQKLNAGKRFDSNAERKQMKKSGGNPQRNNQR